VDDRKVTLLGLLDVSAAFDTADQNILLGLLDVSAAFDTADYDILLGLLDLSAAFDTTDHDILQKRLEVSFGIGGSVLDWTQAVSFQNVISEFIPLQHGVPQGSALGPILFILYTADVERIATQHGVDHHSYADDAQLDTSCFTANPLTSVAVLLRCINDVDIWISSNWLRLNAEKTQFIWVGSSQMLAKTNKEPLRVGGVDILTLDAVHDLGLVLD